ncbi:uncharacterized protein [Bemisia tabaci]|uniref:uncharacterized protein isoform X1 n=1 Tax=Bemisia tabaci TaxID=7038 RepID=UPI0008F988DD|nr:PREDICTED: targeting protein for Xklp2 homolog isoform X1 [Bemisia tabaci]
MATPFKFNAPMFTDFLSSDQDDINRLDKFFCTNDDLSSKPVTRISIKQEIASPRIGSSDKRKSLSLNSLHIKEETKSPSPVAPVNKRRSPRSATRNYTATDDSNRCRSRSRSCVSSQKPELSDPSNHESILNQALEHLTVSAKKKKLPGQNIYNGIQLDPSVLASSNKEHPMMTRRDKIIKTPVLVLRTRSVLKSAEKINPSASEKRSQAAKQEEAGSRKRKSLQPLEALCLPLFSNQASSEVDTADVEMQDGIVQMKIPKHPQDDCVQLSCPPPRKSTVTFSDVKYEPKKPDVHTDSKGPYNFSAKPDAGSIFPVTRKRLVLTEPKTPQLRTARRSVARTNNRVAVINSAGGSQTFKFQTVLHTGVPANIKSGPTEVKPFSFEERDKQMLLKKEQKIKQMLEEERKKAEFHANPLPSYLNVKKEIPIPSTRSYTLSKRRTLYKFELNEKENPAPLPFKAQPPTVLQKDPFIPKKADRPLLEIPDFELKTERRAREREQFEITMKEREAQMEMALREREAERKRQEEREIAMMRQQAVHKAQPVPKVKPPQIKPSMKPLTNPVSPKFSSRFTRQEN